MEEIDGGEKSAAKIYRENNKENRRLAGDADTRREHTTGPAARDRMTLMRAVKKGHKSLLLKGRVNHQCKSQSRDVEDGQGWQKQLN